MEFVVYILRSSCNTSKTYIGFTSHLIQRIYWCNNGNKGHTQKFRPWAVVYVEFYQTKSEAMKREKYLKTGVGREWIINQIL